MQEKVNKILYVGVSPKPYYGYNYWYVDLTGKTQPKTFVWVKMGRRDTEQLVYVDSVKWCDRDKVPYPLEKVKHVLAQATLEQSDKAKKDWDNF